MTKPNSYSLQQQVYQTLQSAQNERTIEPIQRLLEDKTTIEAVFTNPSLSLDVVTTLDSISKHDGVDVIPVLKEFLKIAIAYSDGSGSRSFKYGARILAEQYSSFDEFLGDEDIRNLIEQYNQRNPIWGLEQLVIKGPSYHRLLQHIPNFSEHGRELL